jgi:UDP:flavonoid glycosyltransferase YjiC (YdhE family)
MLDKLQYHEIMPFTDIFITNGGFGGVQLALSYGVPLIIAGRTDDKGEVAARIAWSKCGINLKTSSPSPRSICRAVQKILSGKKIKLRAQEIKNFIKKENAPEFACELLEELIR